MSQGTDSQRISRLGLDSFISRITIHGLGLMASIAIARALGPEGRGRYYLPVTAAIMAATLANLGSVSAQLRLWSRRAASPESFVTAGIVLTILLGGGAVGLAWIVFAVGGTAIFPDVQWFHLVVASAAIPFLVHQSRTINLLAMNRDVRSVNLARITGAAVHTTGVLILYLLGYLTLLGVLVLFVVSAVVPSTLMLARSRNIGRVRLPIPWALVWQHLRLGMFLAPAAVLTFLHLRVDVFFLARYEGADGVGIYSIAVAFAELIWLASDALVLSITSVQANATEKEAIDVTLRAARMNLLLALMIGAAIIAGAPIVIPLVYGDAFGAAVGPLGILLLASAAMAVWKPLGSALARVAAPGVPTMIAVAAIVANVIANLIFIPRFGLVGAALASLLSYTLGASLAATWLLVSRKMSPIVMLPTLAEVRQLKHVTTLLRAGRGRANTRFEVEDIQVGPQ